MDELDSESKALFDAARSATNPTSADRARITAGLSAKLGGAAFLATSGVSAGTLVKSGTILGTLKTLIVHQIGPALLVGAAVGGTASYAVYSSLEPREHEVAPQAQTARVPQLKRSATAILPMSPPIATDQELLPTPVESRQQNVSTRPKAPKESPSELAAPATESTPEALTEPETTQKSAPESSGLSTELQLIARMHAASRAGDWGAVDRAVVAHEQQFPAGALAEEREAIKTIAACRSASHERAEQLGGDFAKHHSGSTYVARVRAACGAERP